MELPDSQMGEYGVIIQNGCCMKVMFTFEARWKFLVKTVNDMYRRTEQYGPQCMKTCLWWFPTKGHSNQPAQLQRLAKNENLLLASLDMILSYKQIKKW